MQFMALHVTVSSSEHPDDRLFNPLFSRGREVYVQSILARIIYEIPVISATNITSDVLTLFLLYIWKCIKDPRLHYPAF